MRSAWGKASRRCENSTTVHCWAYGCDGPKSWSQASDDPGFGVQVQGRERIVQDQQSWRQRAGGGHGPCQCYALALTTGDAYAQFADFRLQASRKGAQILTKGGARHGRCQHREPCPRQSGA